MPFGYIFSGTVQRLSQALRATSGTRAGTRVSALLRAVIQKTGLRRIGLKAKGSNRGQVLCSSDALQGPNPGMDQKATKHTWPCSWGKPEPLDFVVPFRRLPFGIPNPLRAPIVPPGTSNFSSGVLLEGRRLAV